jgi:hypothetical protein
MMLGSLFVPFLFLTVLGFKFGYKKSNSSTAQEVDMRDNMFNNYLTALTLTICCFNFVGPVFRPKWYLAVICSSTMFIIARTLMFQNAK